MFLLLFPSVVGDLRSHEAHVSVQWVMDNIEWYEYKNRSKRIFQETPKYVYRTIIVIFINTLALNDYQGGEHFSTRVWYNIVSNL